METPGFSALKILFIALPVLAAIIILALSLLTRYWQRETLKALKRAQAGMRQFVSQNKKTRSKLDGQFSPTDPPPFGPLTNTAKEALEEVDHQVHLFHKRYTAVQQTLNDITEKNWQNLLRAPLNWQNLYQRADQLKDQEREIKRSQREMRAHFQKLENVGWVVAEQARKANQSLQEICEAVDRLSAQNVHGQNFESIQDQKQRLITAFDTIPVPLLAAEGENILEQVGKNEIANAHQVLENNLPIMQKFHSQVKHWSEQRTNVTDDLMALEIAADRLYVMVNEAPYTLDLAETQSQLNRINSIIGKLNVKLSQPLAEDLNVMVREARHARQAVESLSTQLEEACSNQAELKQILSDIHEGMELLSHQYQKLENSPFFPILLDQSRPMYISLMKQIEIIGSAEDQRTPERVKSDLERARKQYHLLAKLIEDYEEIIKHYSEFLSYQKMLDSTGRFEWGEEVRQMLEEISAYNPANWENKEELDLLDELKTLEDRLKTWSNIDAATQVRESRIPQLLAEAFRLSELYQMLQRQVDEVNKRFQEIQNKEQKAFKYLNLAREILKHIDNLAVNNKSLDIIIAAEVDPLWHESEEYVTDLQNHLRGLVDKKVKNVELFTRRIEQIANSWVNQLNIDTEAMKNSIASTLNELMSLAPLDDPIVGRVRETLARVEHTTRDEAHAESGMLIPLKELENAITRADQAWQKCETVMKELLDIESPIVEAHQNTMQQRKNARKLLERAGELVTQQGSPNDQNLTRLEQEFDVIERDWEIASVKQARPEVIIRKLDGLAKRYQAVIEKTRQITTQAEDKLERVEQLVKELERSLQLWQEQRLTLEETSAAYNEIDNLVDDTEEKMGQLNKQYSSGQSNYQQMMTELMALSKRVNNALISIDNNQVMDINGDTRRAP